MLVDITNTKDSCNRLDDNEKSERSRNNTARRFCLKMCIIQTLYQTQQRHLNEYYTTLEKEIESATTAIDVAMKPNS